MLLSFARSKSLQGSADGTSIPRQVPKVSIPKESLANPAYQSAGQYISFRFPREVRIKGEIGKERWRREGERGEREEESLNQGS